MNPIRHAAVIACLAALSAALQFLSLGMGSELPDHIHYDAQTEISIRDVANLESLPLWVDARSRTDYDRGHIPGAIHIDHGAWDVGLPQLLASWKPNRPIIVYCSSEECEASKGIAERLREGGLEPVMTLRGGWAAWVEVHP